MDISWRIGWRGRARTTIAALAAATVGGGVAEARCNWYLRDINIFRLSKKDLTIF
jgi:hypothetical protein